MISGSTYLQGLIAMTFVVSSAIVAAVRWFHMCRPYDKHPEYYYPARKHFLVFSLFPLLLIPFIVNPVSTDAIYLVKTYLLPVLVFNIITLSFAYFGNVMQWQKWRTPTWTIGFPILIFMTVVFVFSLLPGEQIGEGGVISCKTADIILLVLGFLITIIAVNSLLLIWKWAKSFDEDDYSNPADFPVPFALKMMVFMLIILVVVWTGTIIGSPAAIAIVMVVLSVSNVIFLIVALHPQRSREYEETDKIVTATTEEESTETGRQGYLQALSKDKEAEILYAIQAVVVEQEAFLDPHLTIQDIANRCGYSRTYIAGLFKSELGGFFRFINTLRLQYAENYQAQHPEATIQEVATESGFGSRQTYYSVKARLSAEQ